jgi:hypothetical protein
MYDCYGKPSDAKVGGFAMSIGQEVDFSFPGRSTLRPA